MQPGSSGYSFHGYWRSRAELNFGKLNDDIVRNRGLATTYNNMALVNIEMGKFKEALDLLDKALTIRQGQ